MKNHSLKLIIDLVPTTCFYSNLRKAISQSKWNKIRKQVIEEQDNKCCVCGASGKLQCHEDWKYDDINHIQNLSGFKAMCVTCHQVTHLGMSIKLSEQGYVDLEDLVNHFMDVNNVDRITYKNHLNESFDIFEERSKHKWETNFGKYQYLIA